ncbi:medium-chain acyl-CoA ligase ACSF2, mitochondrial-like [Halyomorpha halys]|uniref:medium-chain acyl-CoA ligase ACSF2, mitochondrial-like n=1 Tax=Halyomorpha halys TaxID=286706 RepID=UPI0006D4C75B|nr:acyl-CoA synthetase family member 2, mitochondrial-like [Halyomorpha halys]
MGVLRRAQALLIWNIKRCLSGDVKKPAYYHNPGSERLRAITTGQLINLAAEKWPTRDAIISLHEGKKLTFTQLKEQAEQLGAGFIKLGLKPGDRLAVIGANTIHWYLTMQAAAKAGLILVMLNPAYRPLELSYALKHVGVKGLVADHKFKTQNYHEILAEVAPGISTAPHGKPLNCSELPDLSFVIVATDQKLPGCYRYDDIMVSPQEKEIIHEVENQVQPDGPSCIQFSSGTTGQPKAAVLSHFGTINNGHFFGKSTTHYACKFQCFI